MSLTQPQYSPPDLPADSGVHESSIRLEDLLRLIFAGVLVLVGGLALGNVTFHELASRGTGYFLIAGCVAIIMTALAYYKFEPMLILFIALIWVNRGGTPDVAQGVSSGTGKSLYPVELATMFLLFVWLLRGAGPRLFRIAKTPINGWLIIYLVFSVWTAINGWMFWDPALTHFYAGLPGGGKTAPAVIVLELTLRLLSVGAFWLIAANLTEAKWLRRAGIALLLPGLLTMLIHLHVLPDFGNVYDSLLEIVLATMLWAWLLEVPNAKPGLRALGWLGLALIICQDFLMNLRWISGWTGLFIGLLFVAWLKSRKLFFGLVCTAAVLVVLAHPFLQANVVHKVQTSGDLDRFSMQQAALKYALKFPMGIGPGNFRAYNMYYGSRQMWNTTGYTSAHNFYGQALSEMGFVGFFLTLAFVIAGLVMVTRFYHRSPPGWSRTMILGIAGMWAGFGASSYLGDYIIPVYHNGGLENLGTTLYCWIGLGLAVALARYNGALQSTTPAAATAVQAPMSAASYYPRRLAPPKP